jgi:hypothetical protein
MKVNFLLFSLLIVCFSCEKQSTLAEQRNAVLGRMLEKGQSPFDPFTKVVAYDINEAKGFLDLELDLEGIERFFIEQGMQFDFEDFKKFQIQDTPIAFRQPQFMPFWKLFDSITLTYHNKSNEELFEVICTE